MLEWYVLEQLRHPILILYSVSWGRSFVRYFIIIIIIILFLFELISKRWMYIHLRMHGLRITN